jgi:hypothetical protein
LLVRSDRGEFKRKPRYLSLAHWPTQRTTATIIVNIGVVGLSAEIVWKLDPPLKINGLVIVVMIFYTAGYGFIHRNNENVTGGQNADVARQTIRFRSQGCNAACRRLITQAGSKRLEI